MHMEFNDIGKALRQARKSMRRTQAEVAAPLGMSRATISAIENGTVNEIGVRKLMALCASLGLQLSVGPCGSRPTLSDLREEHRAALKSRP
jgi:HTH-type transcriptional regulator/antitoxin HipB